MLKDRISISVCLAGFFSNIQYPPRSQVPWPISDDITPQQIFGKHAFMKCSSYSTNNFNPQLFSILIATDISEKYVTKARKMNTTDFKCMAIP